MATSRAADDDSPAPRGHYLREFGQSDRETIENANYDASVPQVLALMNSQLLPQVLEKYSQLMLTVNKAPYPDDKVDAIFTALLSILRWTLLRSAAAMCPATTIPSIREMQPTGPIFRNAFAGR